MKMKRGKQKRNIVVMGNHSTLVKKRFLKREQVFVSDLEIPSLKTKVKLIGISHGPFMTPRGFKRASIVKGELSKEPEVILAEGRGREFVSGKFRKRRIALRDLDTIRSLETRILVAKAKTRSFKALLAEYFNEIIPMVKKVEGIAPRISLQLKSLKNIPKGEFIKRYGITPKEFEKAFGLITSVRSLLIASEVIKYATIEGKKPKSITVVAGSGHMAEIESLLKNPNLALRYIQKVRAKIKYKEIDQEGETIKRFDIGGLFVIEALDRAKQNFSRLVT